MAEGTVKWFDRKKGYGFISEDEGGDVFVHHTSLSGTADATIKEGDRVDFDIVQGEKGPRAANVKVKQ